MLIWCFGLVFSVVRCVVSCVLWCFRLLYVSCCDFWISVICVGDCVVVCRNRLVRFCWLVVMGGSSGLCRMVLVVVFVVCFDSVVIGVFRFDVYIVFSVFRNCLFSMVVFVFLYCLWLYWIMSCRWLLNCL